MLALGQLRVVVDVLRRIKADNNVAFNKSHRLRNNLGTSDEDVNIVVKLFLVLVPEPQPLRQLTPKSFVVINACNCVSSPLLAKVSPHYCAHESNASRHNYLTLEQHLLLAAILCNNRERSFLRLQAPHIPVKKVHLC